MVETPIPIAGNDDLIVRVRIMKPDPATSANIPNTGLTVILRLSATKGGATLHANVSVTMTEAGVTGYYTGTIPGGFIQTHVAGAAITDGWIVVAAATSILRSARFVVVPGSLDLGTIP
jgi:hypothetical protein